jgi:hypothetical protein
LDGEKHGQSFFTGWSRAAWDDVEERSDHLRGGLSEKRKELIVSPISIVHSPGNICRMEGRISDKIDLLKLLAFPFQFV